MADDKVKIETEDKIEVEAEDSAPIEEEPKEPKVKKAKKPKPARGKGRKEKGKGAEKGFSKGHAWWKDEGFKLARKGKSQRGIILLAAKAAGVGFDKAMDAMRGPGDVEDKAKSLFDS